MSEWKAICQVSDIPTLGARRVQRANGPEVALFRTTDDRVFALLDRCPHKAGPLSQGLVHGTAVTCPLHGWNIALDTGRAHAPDEGTTPAFSVKVDNDTVYLDNNELATLAIEPIDAGCGGACACSR